MKDIKSLWRDHQALAVACEGQGASSGTRERLFDIKLELGRRLMSSCCLCERRCGVDRFSGERGFCGVGPRSHYYGEGVSYSEELNLIPSYAVYLSGCNFRCPYCYTREDSWDPDSGGEVQVEELSQEILRQGKGINNVNFFGGDPTPHLVTILSVGRRLNGKVPMLWNSNMYCSPETIKLLKGVVDIYLGDFRHGNDGCGERYAGVKDYTRIVKRNLILANGSARLIVRHLLLPGHFECCFLPVVEWVEGALPGIEFSLSSEYVPYPKMKGFEEIGREIGREEMARARALARDKGLNLVD